MAEFKQKMNKNAQVSNDLLVGTTGSSMCEPRLEIQQALDKALQAANPSPRNPNFWERRYAAMKAAAPDTVGSIQKTNRNIKPAEKSLSELMGVELNEEPAEREQANKSSRMPHGEIVRCQRFCQQPGREICKFCKGAGFHVAMKKRRETEDIEKRELQRQVIALRQQVEALRKTLGLTEEPA